MERSISVGSETRITVVWVEYITLALIAAIATAARAARLLPALAPGAKRVPGLTNG